MSSAWLCMKLESASRNASNSRKLSSVAAGTYYADQGKALWKNSGGRWADAWDFFIIFWFSHITLKKKLYTPYLKVCTYLLILNSNSVFNVTYTMCNYQNQQSDFYNDMLQMFQLFDQNNTSYFFLFGFSENMEGNLFVYTSSFSRKPIGLMSYNLYDSFRVFQVHNHDSLQKTIWRITVIRAKIQAKV